MDITSTQNPRVKQVVKLQQNARERKETGMFVSEGIRECSIALQSGYEPHEIYICEEIYKPDPLYPIPTKDSAFTVTPEVYAKIAYRSGVEGIVIVFKSRFAEINNIQFDRNSLILVLEKVEKPGNLGAIFRTADAAGVSAVLLCDPACDPYNPNAIRSSLGCIFGVPWVITDSGAAIKWLKGNGIRIVSSTPDTSKVYSHENLSGQIAIVMGAEDTGLSPLWLSQSDSLVRIPMLGRIDSLNVSVSAAILLFEAQRQRRK
jgi:TrmH family RNA methyltransferase